MYNLPCTPDGISIALDKPENNNWQLNINRSAVLRQVYGLDIRDIGDGIVERYAYGLGNKTTAEGTDPARVTVQPFNDDLKLMTSIIQNKLSQNTVILKLHNVNISKPFNSCVILLYCTIPDLKNNVEWDGIVIQNIVRLVFFYPKVIVR